MTAEGLELVGGRSRGDKRLRCVAPPNRPIRASKDGGWDWGGVILSFMVSYLIVMNKKASMRL